MSSNIIRLVLEKDMEIDISLCFHTMPPVLVPVSDRARKKFGLEHGTCAMFLEHDAEEVLDAIDDDWVLFNDEEYMPKNIVVMTINKLH